MKYFIKDRRGGMLAIDADFRVGRKFYKNPSPDAQAVFADGYFQVASLSRKPILVYTAKADAEIIEVDGLL